MNLMTMQFGSFVFPVNPTELKLERACLLRETGGVDGEERVEAVGKRRARVVGTVPYTFAFVETTGKSEAVSGRTYRAKAGESLWDYAYFTGVSIDRLAENNRHIACIAALKDGEEVHVP